jgi:hypothetical protein
MLVCSPKKQRGLALSKVSSRKKAYERIRAKFCLINEGDFVTTVLRGYPLKTRYEGNKLKSE